MTAVLDSFRVAVSRAMLVAVLGALPLTVALPAPPAQAQDAPDDPPVRHELSEDAAVAMVREQTEGKVIRVDRKLESGMMVYQIRVLSPDGRLREFRVNAVTGVMR